MRRGIIRRPRKGGSMTAPVAPGPALTSDGAVRRRHRTRVAASGALLPWLCPGHAAQSPCPGPGGGTRAHAVIEGRRIAPILLAGLF